MSWAMTDGEIASMWRTCKDRNEQVNILADLNVKSRVEMLDKLRELGCDLRGVRTGSYGGGAPRKPPIDELRAMQLYRDGPDDLSISEALGESKKARGRLAQAHEAEAQPGRENERRSGGGAEAERGDYGTCEENRNIPESGYERRSAAGDPGGTVPGL